MDGSESVGSCEFGKVQKAIKHLMVLANVRGFDTKYAAVSYATSANINFKFLPYATAANKIMAVFMLETLISSKTLLSSRDDINV